MIHISSYHSNGLQPVVWPNKVNLIGEKVYKPKIHFCEHCNKPILIYGRLIPCKHVFCFSCSTLCLTQQQINANNSNNLAMVSTPPLPGPTEPPSVSIQSPSTFHHQHQSSPINNSTSNDKYQRHSTRGSNGGGCGGGATTNSSSSNTRMLDLHRSDSNSMMNIDESTSNTTPTTIQLDTISSPNQNNSLNGQQKANNNIASAGKGCHRCGNRALRVERNTLNSIFVCQVEACRRTYLSARDLQAHVTHRHSKNKAHNNGTSTASMAAISSSPYITSSSLMHLNHNNQSGTSQRQSSSSTSTTNNTSSNPNHSNNNNSPNNHHPRRGERGEPSHYSHHHHNHHSNHHNARDRDNRDRYNNRDRESYARDRDRERDSKEYHRQSIQRAAQWAEASAQMLEKGLTR